MDWQPIEEIVPNETIWVLKYDIYFAPDGNFCDSGTPGAHKFTDCHGWYATEADAVAVQRHMPKPALYHIERVRRRRLLTPPTLTKESEE